MVSAAQVPDSDEQFVPDFHSENCKYIIPFDLRLMNINEHETWEGEKDDKNKKIKKRK